MLYVIKIRGRNIDENNNNKWVQYNRLLKYLKLERNSGEQERERERERELGNSCALYLLKMVDHLNIVFV